MGQAVDVEREVGDQGPEALRGPMTTDRTTTSLTTDIVAAYVMGNRVTLEDLPAVIQAVSRTLRGLGEPDGPQEAPVARTSAARIRKSITPDGLVSFEDGKSYKQLKRHLGALGLSPDQYRAKWGLAADYPMVSPNYSAQRSALAKSYGLGRKVRPPKAAQAPVTEPQAEPQAEPAATPKKPRKAGRLGLFGRGNSAT